MGAAEELATGGCWGKGLPGRASSKCKGPESGTLGWVQGTSRAAGGPAPNEAVARDEEISRARWCRARKPRENPWTLFQV